MSAARAPDGLPWPLPRALVDTSEQHPLAFGHVPALWEANAPVHHGQIDQRMCEHPLMQRLAKRQHMPYPWHATRANLGEGDYQLLDVRTGAALERFACIETKRRDLVSSYTWGHDRLEAEFQRMAPYRFKAIVATVSVECLVGLGPEHQPPGAAGKEASLVCGILALSWRYGVMPYFMPRPANAEHAVAFCLADAWQLALEEDPSLLAAVRLVEMNEAAHARPEERAPAAQPDPRASPRIRHPGIPGSPRPSWSREAGT